MKAIPHNVHLPVQRSSVEGGAIAVTNSVTCIAYVACVACIV